MVPKNCSYTGGRPRAGNPGTNRRRWRAAPAGSNLARHSLPRIHHPLAKVVRGDFHEPGAIYEGARCVADGSVAWVYIPLVAVAVDLVEVLLIARTGSVRVHHRCIQRLVPVLKLM